MSPFFSIIIPTFNRAHLISTSIESILRQVFPDWELLIIDDGSTDNTKEIVSGYVQKDIRINYIYQRNQERSAARNNGINNASGKYICFLDSDDYYLPDHLQNFYDEIIRNNSPIAMFATNMLIDNGGRLTLVQTFNKLKYDHPIYYFWYNTILTPIAVCIHHEILKKHKFDENYKKCYWEDTHLWIRILANYPFIHIAKFSVAMVEHKSRSVTSSMKQVSYELVIDYVNMVKDLLISYPDVLGKHITPVMLKDYIQSKIKMYVYMARMNKQIKVAFALLHLAIKNKCTFAEIRYYAITTIKLLLSSLNNKKND